MKEENLLRRRVIIEVTGEMSDGVLAVGEVLESAPYFGAASCLIANRHRAFPEVRCQRVWTNEGSLPFWAK
jgi:hypothetical protein